MENLIKKVYEEKLNDGSIENIISNKIDEMVKGACDDLFKWDGVIRKQIKDKLNEAMGDVLRKTSFEDYVPQFQMIIDKAMPNTCADTYRNCIDSIIEIIGKKPKIEENLTAQQIFDKYIDWVEESTLDYDYVDAGYIDRGIYCVNCRLKVEDHYYEKEVTLEIFDDNVTDCYFKDTHTVRFSVSNAGYIRVADHKISELARLSKFQIYLIKLQASFAKCELPQDISDLECTAECEVER